jgi:flagellar motility protein MotE (MotC chaperone)
MLGLFRKKTPTEKLEKRYDKLIQEAFELSTVNRKESDKKTKEAADVLERIKQLHKEQ